MIATVILCAYCVWVTKAYLDEARKSFFLDAQVKSLQVAMVKTAAINHKIVKSETSFLHDLP